MCFCGDECYSLKCLTNKILTGNTVSPENSLKFIREYFQNKYIPLLSHDGTIMPNKVGNIIICD